MERRQDPVVGSKRRRRMRVRGDACTSTSRLWWILSSALILACMAGEITKPPEEDAKEQASVSKRPPSRDNRKTRPANPPLPSRQSPPTDKVLASIAHYPTPQEHKDQPDTPLDSVQLREEAHAAQIELAFIHWCEHTLGIYTILEIQTFEYYDHMKAMPREDWDDESDEDCPPVDDLPMIPVRGLAASRDIKAGETVIRIPLGALLSVTTTIDKDPILTQVMGPLARQANGWIGDITDETSPLLEMPLLAVALLYHLQHGEESKLFPYMQLLQLTKGVDSLPFLWSPTRLREQASEGIRVVARGIKSEMAEMYDTVVEVLIDQHPKLFGPVVGKEWMFSGEKFEWAFAMINTRHWQLPIDDLHMRPSQQPTPDLPDAGAEDADSPPAGAPTEHWVEDHGTESEHDGARGDKEGDTTMLVNHSFLAPFADLLNFGPPCTKGRYDSETHSFEITALCDYKKGQEVTFYYSDECDHLIAGAYGFMHPIVPPCPSAEEYRHRSEEWQEQAERFQRRLAMVYAAMEEAEDDIDHLHDILDECECCRREYRANRRNRRNGTDDDDDLEPSHLRHEHVRGAASVADAESSRDARHGVRSRRRRREQRTGTSEF